MSTVSKASHPVRRGLSLLGGSLMLLSVLGGARASAQTTTPAQSCPPTGSNAAIFNPTTGNMIRPTPGTQAQETIPPLRTRLNRVGSISPRAGQATITLRNTSASEITYEAIAATDPRTLASGEEVVLSGLDIPTTISFYQKDGGLTQAAVSDVSYEDGSFTVEFSQAPTLDEDDNSLVLLRSGGIYFM